MIGKHIRRNPKKRSSFKGLNDYITGNTKRQVDDKIAFTDCINLASVETATLEMESLASLNKLSADPVMHLLLCWRENEVPTPEQVLEAVRITLDELNLSQCQAVYSLHQNTDNLHLHICVNRIDPETHRAIDPAHGWTRNGMERAARRIEHAQGWQVENNAWSEVDSEGRVIRKPMTSRVKIPQEAKDAENLTGEQSAIRKAQEVLKDAIKDIHSWEHLHGFVRTKWMAYEKKGSGAVIRVGEIVVKASSVSRNLSLNKLEKLFGEYQSQLNDSMNTDAAKISEPKPLDKSNDNANWRAYIAERNDYYKDKKRVREELSMTQREEKKAMRDRHSGERASMFKSFKEHPCSRSEIKRQRSILASKHAYERAVLKESQKASRDELKNQRPAYRSYEQWLRDRGLINEADGWRHRKDSGFIQFESPNLGRHESVPTEPKGLPGFNMAVTKQGLRFYRESTPKEASFIDMGRVIRVYKHGDETILAALQLAQEKWGGVKINGSDEYKRRCAEIAAKHGIKVVNPELQDFIKEIRQLKVEPSVPIAELPENERLKPGLSVEAARNIIEAEARVQETRHWKFYGEYREHKKELREHIGSEPEKPLILGVKKWKQEHEKWKIERNNLEHLIIDDMKALGVDTDRLDVAELETEERHKAYREYAHREALRIHPDATETIRQDEARREKEKHEAREAEETLQRQAKERHNAFMIEVRKLMRAADMKDTAFVCDAQDDGRRYTGEILGFVQRGDEIAVAQKIGPDMAILHTFKEIPDGVAIGAEVTLSSRGDGYSIVIEPERDKNHHRGLSR